MDHITAEDAAELYHNDRPRCGKCGKYCKVETSQWRTDYSFNPPDVLGDWLICEKCIIKEKQCE